MKECGGNGWNGACNWNSKLDIDSSLGGIMCRHLAGDVLSEHWLPTRRMSDWVE